MCTGSTPYCQNGGCIQCQYYTDCAASIPKTKCKDAKTIESYVLRNAKCKFNKCEFTATTKACPSSTPYCKDDNGKVSCVQCLSESQCTHLNTPLTYGCTGNTLFKYWATCSANKCNAKGKKWGEVDCSQYKYSNSSTLNLSCLASKGKCGCTTNSQCAKLPDKLSACIPNLYYKTNPTQYMQYNKVCDSNNDCGYKTSTETCQNNTICFDTKTGSKCIACQTNTDCAYMGKDPKYQTKCADKDITTFYFTCKMNNQDPTTSECVAHEETNVCLNGCYQDEQGNNVCKDCKSDSECTKPPVPAVACAKDKKSGYYYDSQGYCRSNTRLCDYGKASVTCVDIPVVTKCKNAQTLITSGPITSCLVQGSKVICNPQIREKKCYGSCKQYGKHAFCSLW
ncbi:MAG: hypothetical protein UT86_C0012G0008 [Candidatus Magasanikbacteria bacterium GW2011_GWC2_40_17]|uniref:Uncharacterized protein n=1 Tax=Candidatus Magasanikbacteria bacterium GW2011_GWA2_42_32 TaxID=1619039 RepID=A0A0G1C516_9BACT|nr:MAG: hypothetical protein UT86_C0012G0008 [Candidatus Magasanikbacteria bacterium GW2011_GWC2_40_17]KKS53746.1 MAG: hypothetical protein UV20_C0046G0003 [Candidatus Magasanikbacteria bacterium GW2011_GWA2_42_32]